MDRGQYADGIVAIADQAGAMPRRRDLASELCRTLDRIGFGSEDSISDSVAAAAASFSALSRGWPMRYSGPEVTACSVWGRTNSIR